MSRCAEPSQTSRSGFQRHHIPGNAPTIEIIKEIHAHNICVAKTVGNHNVVIVNGEITNCDSFDRPAVRALTTPLAVLSSTDLCLDQARSWHALAVSLLIAVIVAPLSTIKSV